jgi:hypothetical protein
MGRAHHLMKTLPQNLRDNPDGQDYQVEFIVLDYGDHEGQYQEIRDTMPSEIERFDYDDMHSWMMSNSQVEEEIKSGRLIYVKTEDLKVAGKFHHSHAKNIAHRVATGDVVCNVDADNFTGQGFAQMLNRFFLKNPNSILNPSFELTRLVERESGGFFWTHCTIQGKL